METDDQTPTIRTTPVDLESDLLPEQAAHYVGPTPLPRMSEHKTIDMVPVRLAPEINPRNAATRRLASVPPRSKVPGLVLGAVMGAVTLGLMALGTLRWLGRNQPAALPTATSGDVSPLAPPEGVQLPAAAMIEEPPAAAPGQGLATVARKPKPSAAPSPKAAPKGREAWLE